MDQKDIELLADELHERMAHEMLRMPAEFSDQCQPNYLAIQTSIPYKTKSNYYFSVRMKTDENGGLWIQVVDINNTIVKEVYFQGTEKTKAIWPEPTYRNG